MIAFVAMGGDQIGTVGWTIDGDFAFDAATDGADFFAFCRTKSRGFAFFADRTGHRVSWISILPFREYAAGTKITKATRDRWGTSRFSGGRILLGDNLSRLAAFALLDGLAEEVFDLTVDATQFVLRPGFELGPERRIDAQKKGLSFHHPCQSVVQRTGVDYGMHFGLAAKNDHEIEWRSADSLCVET
jgi:hypothetical protein